METITIEQIKNNPNLDLSERRKMIGYQSDIDNICIASIKNEYEKWIKERTVVNDRTDYLLEQLLNGHILTNIECLEMICDDVKKIEEAKELEIIKNNIQKNNGITLEDLNTLCDKMELDNEVRNLLKMGFENKNLIVESYSNDDLVGDKNEERTI